MDSSNFILYAQHGWADEAGTIATFARRLVEPSVSVVAPNLGYWRTWLRMEPLIRQVEHHVTETLACYPQTPMQIMGHSMGGLIWLELLDRHPQWWPLVHSLVLIGCPVGGAELARLIDPFGLGIGIARDLGINRRPLAEYIAQSIPTLAIAGHTRWKSDGTISVECTRFNHAQWVCLPNISHPDLRHHPALVEVIKTFWAKQTQKTRPPQPMIST